MFSRLTATPWHIVSWAIAGLVIGYTAVILTTGQDVLAEAQVCIDGEHAK